MTMKAVVFCLFICTSMGQEVNVMKTMSTGIGDIVLQCQKEMQFKKDVIRDFLDFWNEKNELKSKEFGCTLVCVFKKLKLLSDDGKEVIRSSVDKFAKAIGADEKLKLQMLELFQLCRQANEAESNQCEAALETTKCFRYGIFRLHWAPQNEHKVEEGGIESEFGMAARRNTDDDQGVVDGDPVVIQEDPGLAEVNNKEVTEPPKPEGLPSLRRLADLLVGRRFRKNCV